MRMLVQSLLITILALVGDAAARRKQRSKYSPSTSSFTSSAAFSLSDGLPHRPTPVDGHLLDQIAQFRKDMYPRGPQEERKVAHVLTNKQTEEAPFRAPSTVVHWKPLECSVLDYDLRKVGSIHKGSRNSVYKLTDCRTGQLYAWKIFAKPDEYTAELAFFMVANHPLIVKPLCVMQEPHDGRAGLVMEYVEDGLHSRRYLEQNPEDLVRISAQAYDVLKYMHWLGFIHADFKPENVLIDNNGNVKAIDFGFAIHMPYFKYYRGTPNTNAPELMRLLPKAPILENIDWWAFGATVAQWHGSSTMAPIRLSRQEHHRWIMLRLSKSDGYYFGKVPHEFPKVLREMLYYCWTPDPTMRQWNRKSQLVWFESLPFWDGVDFGSIGYKWASAYRVLGMNRVPDTDQWEPDTKYSCRGWSYQHAAPTPTEAIKKVLRLGTRKVTTLLGSAFARKPGKVVPLTFHQEIKKVCSKQPLNHSDLVALFKHWKVRKETIGSFGWDDDSEVMEVVNKLQTYLQELEEERQSVQLCLTTRGDMERRLYRIFKGQDKLKLTLRSQAFLLFAALEKMARMPQIMPDFATVSSYTLSHGLLTIFTEIVEGIVLIVRLASLVVYGNVECGGPVLPPLPHMHDLLVDLATRKRTLVDIQAKLGTCGENATAWANGKPKRGAELARLQRVIGQLDRSAVTNIRFIDMMIAQTDSLTAPRANNDALTRLRPKKLGVIRRVINLLQH